jgi:hypothetical protein
LEGGTRSGSPSKVALLSLRSRNHARSAFHTVFSTPSLILFMPLICGCFLAKVQKEKLKLFLLILGLKEKKKSWLIGELEEYAKGSEYA